MMPPGPVVAGWARTPAANRLARVHRGRRLDGWCIEGFVAVAVAVAALAPFLGLSVAAGAYRGYELLRVGQAEDRRGRFSDLHVGVRAAARAGLLHAVVQVSLAQAQRHHLERLGGGGDLGQDVDAVPPSRNRDATG
jgi:hypothetical protein